MRKLVWLVLIGGAAWSWHKGELPFWPESGAFDANGDPAVLIFTVRNCGKPCQEGRDELSWRRVQFEEKQIDLNNDADENVKLWKKFRSDNRFPLIVAGTRKVVGSNRPEIAGILAMNFGDKHLTRNERRYFKRHFYEDGSPKIVMYGADWCPHCRKLRKQFNDNDVDFIEIDVEKSGEMETMSETMGVYGYPTTWVGYSRVRGSDLKAVKNTLRSY